MTEKQDKQDRQDRADGLAGAHLDIAVLTEQIGQVVANTACLPELCLQVARQDEKIKAQAISLGKVWGLLLALIASLMAGGMTMIGILWQAAYRAAK